MARVCPHCGTQLADFSDICPECLTPLGEELTLPLSGPDVTDRIVQEGGYPEQHRVGMAIVCLRLSTILYGLIGALTFLRLILFDVFDESHQWKRFAICLIFFCLAMIFGIEQVVSGLQRRKFWAWVAGIILFGIYLPSLFLPLGAFGLWGLLDPGSRARFGISGGRRRS